MTKRSDKEFELQCRLCTSVEEGHIQIFSPEGESRNLAAKIKECLPVLINKGDALPKSVCKMCLHKLDELHKFRRGCMEAEVILKEQQQPAFPLEPECCLQEVDPPSSTTAIDSTGSSISRTKDYNNVTPQGRVDIFPRPNSPTMKKLMERQGFGDLVITAVPIKNEDGSISPDSVKPKIENSSQWSCVGHPTLEDYVLMKEDTFTIDSSFFENRSSRVVASGQIEFYPNHDASVLTEHDKDILLAQRRKREILPPMWDVFEKVAVSSNKENSDFRNGKYNITHRRYIISKGAFPCSLCKRCFRINQGFEREGSKWRDIYDGDENSADYSNSKSSDYDEAGGSSTPKDIKYFSCHICCKVFPRRSSLKRHQRTHMDRKLFSCPLCQKGFNRKEHLSRHMISHSGGRPYNCDICEKPFTRKEHLSRHRLCHLNDIYGSTTPEMSLQSSNENSVEPSSSLMNVLGHDDEESSSSVAKPYVCDFCGQGFARKEHLLRHQLRTHRKTPDIRDELKPYNCNVCFKNFTRKEHLVRHQKIHMRDFLFGSARGVIPGTDVSVSPVLTNRAISSGGTVMKTEPLEGLIPHSNLPGLSISTVSSKLEPSASWDKAKKNDFDSSYDEAVAMNGQDDEMSVQDSVEQTLADPERESLGDADDGDSTAAAAAASDYVLDVLKPHKCQFCSDKSFTRRSHLVRHFKRFHSDKPLSLVLSGRRRATLQEKQEFERFMLNDGQYWCVICGKTFGRRQHLLRHMKLHGPNEVARPFHCSACNNSFSRHEYFQKHICKASNEENPSPVQQEDPKPNEEIEKVKKVPAKRDKRKRSKCNYECVTCGKGFSKKKLLNRHSESHADLMEDNSQPLYE